MRDGGERNVGKEERGIEERNDGGMEERKNV